MTKPLIALALVFLVAALMGCQAPAPGWADRDITELPSIVGEVFTDPTEDGVVADGADAVSGGELTPPDMAVDTTAPNPLPVVQYPDPARDDIVEWFEDLPYTVACAGRIQDSVATDFHRECYSKTKDMGFVAERLLAAYPDNRVSYFIYTPETLVSGFYHVTCFPVKADGTGGYCRPVNPDKALWYPTPVAPTTAWRLTIPTPTPVLEPEKVEE